MEAEDTIHIEIEIVKQKIGLWIKKEHEIYYREAEKRINDKALNFANKWGYMNPQDLLSKLLIDLMVNYIVKEKRLDAYEDELCPKMEHLLEMAENMNTAVARLQKESQTQNVDL